MSVYWDILTAVQHGLLAMPERGSASVRIRPKPIVSKDADTPPVVIVCPRVDMWEDVAELQLDNNAFIDYAVLIGVIIDSTFDQAALQYQLNIREAIRLRFFKPDAIPGVTSVFDVRYEPNPKPVDGAALAANLAPSFQQFTYRSSEARAAS